MVRKHEENENPQIYEHRVHHLNMVQEKQSDYHNDLRRGNVQNIIYSFNIW